MKAESPRLVFSVSRAGVALTVSFAGLALAGAATLVSRRVPLAAGIVLLSVGVWAASKVPRADLRSAVAKWGLVLVSVVVTLLMCEAGVRVYFAARHIDIRQYQPSFIYAYTNERQFDRRRFISHPFLPYAPRPFDSRTLYIHQRKDGEAIPYEYSQNSLGFRSPERPFVKPAKTVRIITLGGSTTWDGPTNDQTWPALLEKKLNAHYAGSGSNVEVINMATDGYSSPMSLISLALIGVEFAPDLVISYDGINDVRLSGYEGLTPDYRSAMTRFDDRFQTLQSRLPRLLFRSYLVSLLSRKYDATLGGSPDVMGQIFGPTRRFTPSSDPFRGVEYFERNLRLMRGIAKEYNARFAASTAHWANPIEKQVIQNARLREFLEREHIAYVDLDALLPHNDWTLHVDAVHWTIKGLEAVSDEWAKKIIAADLLGLNNRTAGQGAQ